MKKTSCLEVITINNLVKEYRKERKMTQRQLAKQVGVTERTIISVEKGKYKPSIVLAYKLAQAFKTNIEDLFCLKEYVENE
ncbi:helix-turn-helix transcriptional regulator [Lactobacillus taiwanensis]|uniref:helix-turn-helix transcriptional regulator n=1 Tax=Lactobacillus taiwanensis TaxID=508451 RepID=UPI00272AAAE6|nr:helix-turn-helix transcriptional regulator [Lactobacillus taiwanensis]